MDEREKSGSGRNTKTGGRKASPGKKTPEDEGNKGGASETAKGGKRSEDEGNKESGMTLDADLAVTIQAPQKYPLGITPFAVTVMNRGPGPATAARLTGSISPARLNYATTSTGKCSVKGAGFSCDLGTIAANQSRAVSLQARTEREGKAQISAEARSGAPDHVTANNRARAAIEVKKAEKGTWSAPRQ